MQEKDVIVQFTRAWRHYNPKECAGFDPLTAEKLVDGGVAEYHKVRKVDEFEEGTVATEALARPPQSEQEHTKPAESPTPTPAPAAKERPTDKSKKTTSTTEKKAATDESADEQKDEPTDKTTADSDKAP